MTSPAPQDLPYDEQIGYLSRQLAIAREKVAELEAELGWWQRGRELFGSASGGPPTANGAKPTLAQAIFLVADEALPERVEWTAPEVIEALTARGWMPNGKNAEHTVRNKLSQLARPDGSFRRVRHGVYVLVVPGDSAPATEHPPSLLGEA
jgi:hypothetical protein